jgi:hypothetical protein
LGGCLRILKSVPLLTETAAHAPHRGRDPRLLETGRLNERLLRKQPAETQRHHEPNVEDGGEDWSRVEGMAGLFCGGHISVLVRVAVLRAGHRLRGSMSKARTRVLYKEGLEGKESGVWGSKLAGATRALGLDFFGGAWSMHAWCWNVQCYLKSWVTYILPQRIFSHIYISNASAMYTFVGID